MALKRDVPARLRAASSRWATGTPFSLTSILAPKARISTWSALVRLVLTTPAEHVSDPGRSPEVGALGQAVTPEKLGATAVYNLEVSTEQAMNKKTPPVPDENRSRKGTGSDPEAQQNQHPEERKNLAEQGRQGNIRQNTRNKGYQQNR